jgi:hypothetical protein
MPMRLHVEPADNKSSEAATTWDGELAFIEQLRAQWSASGRPAARQWRREDLYE